jgi:hypothetical protein
LFIVIELALLVLVVFVLRLRQQDELFAELAGSRGHVCRDEAAGKLGIEGMSAAWGASMHQWAMARRATALL